MNGPKAKEEGKQVVESNAPFISLVSTPMAIRMGSRPLNSDIETRQRGVGLKILQTSTWNEPSNHKNLND